jgi:hypothetical protein
MAVAAARAAGQGRASAASPGLVARFAANQDLRLLVAGFALWVGILTGMFLESSLMVAVAAAAFGAAVLYPPLGLVVLAFMGPLRQPQEIPAPGFSMILVGAILLGCVYRLPQIRGRFRARAPLLFLIALLVYVFAQQLPEMATGYASDRAHDIGFLFYQLCTGLGTIVAAGILLRGRSPYPVLVAVLFSATFAALLAITTANGVPIPGLANLLAPSDISFRATGPFGNPNSFGQLLAYGGVLAAGWVANSHSVRVRVGLVILVGVMAYALSLSLSRGAIATLLAGLVVLAFARSRALGLLTVTAALALVVVGYPLFVELRLSTEAGGVNAESLAQLAASDEGRLDAILAGPELFAISPIFGIGFGQYEYLSAVVTGQPEGIVAHNWYGTVLAEQGLLGIVLWALALIAASRWLRERPARPRSIGFALLGAFAVGCMFLSVPTSFQMSTIPIVVLTAALVADWGRSAEVDPTAPRVVVRPPLVRTGRPRRPLEVPGRQIGT